MQNAQLITLFTSYSHDSPEHEQHVLALSDRLRKDGIDANLDQYEQAPPDGWPFWMENQVRDSRFVLVVSSATYLRRLNVGRSRRKDTEWCGNPILFTTLSTEHFVNRPYTGNLSD
jgi:hypothetical protein